MTEKKSKRTFKSKEAEENVRKHQFGQPGGNKQGDPSVAVDQREFYRWAETKATEDELKQYVSDKEKPYARRKFIMTMQAAAEMRDFFELTNQTHGQPKQKIEVDEMPKFNIRFFSNDNDTDE